MNIGKLTNVHEAVQRAQIKVHKQSLPLETGSYRVSYGMKKRAERICDNHGITLSSFLNECVTGLVNDYCNAEVSED